MGFAYDDLGRRTSITRDNGAATSYGFDALSRLTLLTHDMPSFGDFSFKVNEYNPASQITRRALVNDNYAWTNPAGETDTFADNGLNQYTALNGGALSYDGNGNLTADAYHAYVYDAVNRLTSADAGAVTLLYDPAERLAQINETRAAGSFTTATR